MVAMAIIRKKLQESAVFGEINDFFLLNSLSLC